jgi:hypothetical protein
MYAIFETLEEYKAKNSEVSLALGFPNGHGTLSYASEVPMQDIYCKYIMPIMPHVERFFTDCVVVETVQYPEDIQ